jgi:hypothetical protein
MQIDPAKVANGPRPSGEACKDVRTAIFRRLRFGIAAAFVGEHRLGD